MENENVFYDRVLSLRKDYYKQWNIPINLFVETGTATGQTSLWASDHFERVVTVEFMEDLYRSAIESFWNVPNVKLIHGDSSEWIELIFHYTNEPAIWFLDAHNVNRTDGVGPPEETPIMKEVEQIIYSRSEIIIIDDLRLFGAEPGYPTIEEIYELGESRQYELQTFLDEDLIVLKGTIPFERDES